MRTAPKSRAAEYGCAVSTLHKGTQPNGEGEAEVQASQRKDGFLQFIHAGGRGGPCFSLTQKHPMDWLLPAQPLLNSCSQVTLWIKEKWVILGGFFFFGVCGKICLFNPNLLLSRLHARFYKIWFRCYKAVSSPWRFPDKSLWFPVGDNIWVRLAESLSSKAILSPGSHAWCGQLTIYATLHQIAGPYAVFPGIHPKSVFD